MFPSDVASRVIWSIKVRFDHLGSIPVTKIFSGLFGSVRVTGSIRVSGQFRSPGHGSRAVSGHRVTGQKKVDPVQLCFLIDSDEIIKGKVISF